MGKTTDSYVIRKTPGKSLTPEQVRRITQLFRQLDRAEQGYSDASGLKLTRPTDKSLAKWIGNSDEIIHADDKAGRIVGFSRNGRCQDYSNAAYVGALVVDGKLRGRGIGRAILHKAVSDNRRNRLKTVLTVHLANKAGLGLYGSEGFKPVAQTMVLGERPLEKEASAAIRSILKAVVRQASKSRAAGLGLADSLKAGVRNARRRLSVSNDLRRARRYRDDAFPGMNLRVSADGSGDSVIHGVPAKYGPAYDLTLSGLYG